MAADDGERLREAASCERDSRQRRCGGDTADARDDLDLHAGGYACGDLLGAASQHERVAPLEPYDALTGAGPSYEQVVYVGLRRRMSAWILADVDDLDVVGQRARERDGRE